MNPEQKKNHRGGARIQKPEKPRREKKSKGEKKPKPQRTRQQKILRGLYIALTVVAAVIVIFTRYVSLASIVGAAIYPLLVWIFGMGFIEGLVGLFAALLLIFQHRGNIVRLLRGTESKFTLHRGKKRD